MDEASKARAAHGAISRGILASSLVGASASVTKGKGVYFVTSQSCACLLLSPVCSCTGWLVPGH